MYQRELDEALALFLRGEAGIARMSLVSEENRDPRQKSIVSPFSLRDRERLGSENLKKEIREVLARQGQDQSSIHLSVSHTSFEGKSWVLVAGSVQSIGVDLESSLRTVHPQVLLRITSVEERAQFDWDVLKFWVVKEAAFKSNPNNQGTVIPQYQIQHWNTSTQEGSISLPSRQADQPNSWQCRFKFLNLGPWYVAFALTQGERDRAGSRRER